MAKIPEFMLKALYVKGSLRNQGDGFEFQMKNELGPARIIGTRPLQLNRKPIPIGQCRFIHGEQQANFADVTAENSVLMRKGEAIIVKVDNVSLRPGRHTLGINVIVKDMGAINFSVNDEAQ